MYKICKNYDITNLKLLHKRKTSITKNQIESQKKVLILGINLILSNDQSSYCSKTNECNKCSESG